MGEGGGEWGQRGERELEKGRGLEGDGVWCTQKKMQNKKCKRGQGWREMVYGAHTQTHTHS